MGKEIETQACSVLLPLFNGSQFLNDSIISILTSMREIDELVIINDGSEDISKDALTELESRDTRIKVIHKYHSGLVDTLNYGLKLCTNDLIARADVDDKYSQNRISIQVQFMHQNPKCSAVFSDYQILSTSGQDLGSIPTAISPKLTMFSLLNPQRTPHPSVMFRKSAVLEIGGYKPEDFPAEDLSIWIKLSSFSEIATIPETLLFYTLHKSNITNRYQNEMLKKSDNLIRKFAKTIEIDEILEEAHDTFKIYDLSSQKMERKILFFRDFARYLAHIENSKINLLAKQNQLLGQIFNPNSIPAIFKLKRMQDRRKNFLVKREEI